ncbi:MAG: signal peptidase II [Rhodovulum sulfidophilum]|uniref:Lipoprotein signal peptidase n=1 Tax=Rhodovulum sulfidophilum TaxID=35806 RepID=A0A2W5N9K8_RHOSU|nr:MAG: signal peptidase II [Rhodovulum sulfidophilum]
MNQTLRRVVAIATIVYLIDRATKFWVVEVLDLPTRGHIEVFDPWFNLSMAWNRGINFGLLDMGPDAGRWILIGLALAICAGLLVWARRRAAFVDALGIGLIIGGALGNVWDRIRYGAVADFLNFSVPGVRNPFAFNVADAAIFAGAALLLVFARDPAADRPRSARRARKGR